MVSDLQVQSVEGSGLQDGAKWSDSELLLPDVRRGVFIPLIEATLTRTTSVRGGERRDSEKRIEAETRTGEGQGQVQGLGGQGGAAGWGLLCGGFREELGGWRRRAPGENQGPPGEAWGRQGVIKSNVSAGATWRGRPPGNSGLS